jgi:hypothetical protein
MITGFGFLCVMFMEVFHMGRKTDIYDTPKYFRFFTVQRADFLLFIRMKVVSAKVIADHSICVFTITIGTTKYTGLTKTPRFNISP